MNYNDYTNLLNEIRNLSVKIDNLISRLFKDSDKLENNRKSKK